MTLSGAFAAAAAVRRRPQHLVSHSARPGLQGLLLCCAASYVHALLLCCSVTYVNRTPKLAPPVLHQTRAAALCSTWQHNSQTHMCRRRPVLPVVPTYQCQMSMPSVLYRLYLHLSYKHFFRQRSKALPDRTCIGPFRGTSTC